MTTDKSTLRERAYEQIFCWIVDGQLQQGIVTSEVELSKLLDMSRTPVRSALQQLELEGYVRVVPKHGVLILDSSAQRVGDLLEVIASLLLFAINRLWMSDRQEELFRFSEQRSSAFHLLCDSDEASSPALVQFELELLRDLLDLAHNLESIRIFQNAADRLFWHRNDGRWHSPHQHDTKKQVVELILALAQRPEKFRDTLFAYLYSLKRTWA